MKIQSLHMKHVGPIENRNIDFYDEWSGQIYNRILFSGPNGCGKSIVLRAISLLWDVTGYWLDNRRVLQKSDLRHNWLQQWAGIAMILTDLPHVKTSIGIFVGERSWLEGLDTKHKGIEWIGERLEKKGKSGIARRNLVIPENEWVNTWAESRKKMILTFENAKTPNFIYLDAEERRWVSPKRNLGQALPEDSKLRWLVTYQATEDWKGQLEASLLNLKTVKLHKFHDVIRGLNEFLIGKEIDPNVKPGKNRLRVNLKGLRDQSHSIDDLSAGEHQVLIQIYLISRWLERGGIVMIDEPDLYLHPSLISGFLAKLESLVEENQGQLLITSHIPEVWERYEARGMRIRLGGAL